MGKLKEKMGRMAKSIKRLKKEIAELKSGNSSPTPSSPLRRSSSTRALSRADLAMEPARALMQEPIQRRRRSSRPEQQSASHSTGSLEQPLDRAPPMHSAEHLPRPPYGFPAPVGYPFGQAYPPIPPQYFMDPALLQQYYQQQGQQFFPPPPIRQPTRPRHSTGHSTEYQSIAIIELPPSPPPSPPQDPHYTYESMNEDVDSFFHNP
ncbi:PREDICTED: pollen-specific leucine-rich repeat extensin-like protein 1 [Camelina sativa]|uniref:Pollen-specific leucine-rich repeat extensin-like protein 1 n=1 Tax=Camelina sativa TaxID=90675 RepID=A0ABM0VYQ9_CAMSA|nr:PREDICTED: pollen-specific leucine-rich repeat extensin-like protein 1 [Camelina sativa]